MTTQLNVRIDSDLKSAVKYRCEQDGIPLEVAITNLLADFIGDDRFKIKFERDHPLLLPPLVPTIGKWEPKIDSIPFSVVDAWLQRHSEQDTSVSEVWYHCFLEKVWRKRNPTLKERKLIGFYLRRNGWSKTVKVTSTYRVNKLHGRSHVFVKIEPDLWAGIADLWAGINLDEDRDELLV